MATTTDAAAPRTSARVHVQKFGTFLSNMVMPNIGAFIAWGLITALFIKVGWLPVDKLGGWGVNAATCTDTLMGANGEEFKLAAGQQSCSSYGGMVGPMITYLLPLLIAYTGGRMVYDVRGGVVGAIATMGVITGTSIPMFMGAMIMGPLGGWTMKKLDALWTHRIRPGFEMLVNNFSAGIWGAALAVFGFFVMSPIVTGLANAAEKAVDFLVGHDLLPLTSVLIEPAKVLFLNNALNHGVLTPLGTQQALENGKSVLFLLEANPGPGLGLLLAYMVFGRGAAKASAPGAAIIHFFGGIHEIYFPYVLMRPILLVAMIGGGATGVLVNVLFGVGLRAPAAPGSVFAVYAQTATGSYIGVTLAMAAAAGVTFLIASVFLRAAGDDDEGDLAAATSKMESLKGKESSVAGALRAHTTDGSATAQGSIHKIVFACDAGMGSSAMGASVLRKKVQAAGYRDVTVVNQAISNLTDTYDVVVTHQDLTDRARQRTGSAIHVSVDNFMGSPRYDEIVELLHRTNGDGGSSGGSAPAAPPAPAPSAGTSGGATSSSSAGTATAVADAPTQNQMLADDAIRLQGRAGSRDAAIDEAGDLLLSVGAVEQAYVDSMHDREKSVSTYVGNLLAIPHGTNAAKSAIRRTAISFTRYPSGLDWNGNQVKFVIGIAGAGQDHLTLLSQIAEVFLNADKVAELEAATSAADIHRVLGSVST